MQLPWYGKICEGCPADLIVLNARSAYELISPQGRIRRVMRDGIFLNL
jgi:imidazolonepropionase-like amidohydrolase